MKYLYSCILVFMSFSINAQSYKYKSLPARKAVYAEFAGASIIMGVNYDSRFTEDSRLGYRVGLAYGKGFNVPLEVNYLVGKRSTKHKLDLGMGVNINCTIKERESDILPFLNIGYRFQPRNGMIFRVGLSPKLPLNRNDDTFEYLFLWATSVCPYLSLGYAF